jgi:hypothetical protein
MLFFGRPLVVSPGAAPMPVVTLQVVLLVLVLLVADQSFVLGDGDGDVLAVVNADPHERVLPLSFPSSELVQTTEILSRKLKSSKSSKKSESKSLSDKSSKSSKKSESKILSDKSSKSSKKSESKSLSDKSSKSSKSMKSKSLSDKSSKSSKSIEHITENMKQMSMERQQSNPSLQQNENKKGDRPPLGVNEKSPFVKENEDDAKKPLLSSTPFQLALAAAVLAASLVIHCFRMRRSMTAIIGSGGHASGGAYKPIATAGGEAEMTDLGHCKDDDMDVDAEYGEAGSDDGDLGSPGFQRAQ